MNSVGTVLHINLAEKDFVFKSYPELHKLLGGVGIASKLILEHFGSAPVVIATGPLNGYFPFASKICGAFISDDKFSDTYGGGKLSTRLRFAGIDALVFEGTAFEPTRLLINDKGVVFGDASTDLDSFGGPGRKSTVVVSDTVVIDKYFSFGSDKFAGVLKKKNISGFAVSASGELGIEKPTKYEFLYYDILSKLKELTVAPSHNPSCSGCPMGCDRSAEGEVGGNVFIHSLVSCGFAESIYSDISTVFSCLNCLGYEYVHEDLEKLTDLVYSNIGKIYEKIANSKLEIK